jgi:hypothetical protein
MTDYSKWKILIEEADEKAEEYSQVAEWCNENDYTIEDDGTYYKVVKNPEPLPPTKEEQEQNRARAYQEEVDPITCHINRLKDEEQTQEIIFEIEQLKQERSLKVIEIKERYPYSEDEESGE